MQIKNPVPVSNICISAGNLIVNGTCITSASASAVETTTATPPISFHQKKILIVGKRGVGKTSIVEQITKSITQSHNLENPNQKPFFDKFIVVSPTEQNNKFYSSKFAADIRSELKKIETIVDDVLPQQNTSSVPLKSPNSLVIFDDCINTKKKKIYEAIETLCSSQVTLIVCMQFLSFQMQITSLFDYVLIAREDFYSNLDRLYKNIPTSINSFDEFSSQMKALPKYTFLFVDINKTKNNDLGSDNESRTEIDKKTIRKKRREHTRRKKNKSHKNEKKINRDTDDDIVDLGAINTASDSVNSISDCIIPRIKLNADIVKQEPKDLLQNKNLIYLQIKKMCDIQNSSGANSYIIINKNDDENTRLVANIAKKHEDEIDSAIVISRTFFNKHEKIVDKVYKSDNQILKFVLDNAQKMVLSDKTKRMLVVLDNCSDKYRRTRNDYFSELIFNARHYNIILVVVETFSISFTPEIRNNFDKYIAGYTDRPNIKKRLYDQYFGIFPTFDSFNSVFQHAVGEDHYLLLNNNNTNQKITDQLFIVDCREKIVFKNKLRLLEYDPKKYDFVNTDSSSSDDESSNSKKSIKAIKKRIKSMDSKLDKILELLEAA
jgi:hypothetical protein